MKDTNYTLDDMFDAWSDMTSRLGQYASAHPVTDSWPLAGSRRPAWRDIRKCVFGSSIGVGAAAMLSVLLLNPRPMDCWQGGVPIVGIVVLCLYVVWSGTVGLRQVHVEGRRLHVSAADCRLVVSYDLLLSLVCVLLFVIRPCDNYLMSVPYSGYRAECLNTIDYMINQL